MDNITKLFKNYSWEEEKKTDEHQLFVKGNREFSIKSGSIYVYISYPLHESKYNHELKTLKEDKEYIYNTIKNKLEYFEFCNRNY